MIDNSAAPLCEESGISAIRPTRPALGGRWIELLLFAAICAGIVALLTIDWAEVVL